jgi:AbrB family looped-hinge helix DNA binding protein
MALMAITTTIDKAGRVVIPKSVRDELHLEPGAAVEIATDGEQVTMRPVRETSRLRKKQGVGNSGSRPTKRYCLSGIFAKTLRLSTWK